jgi:hypothetical protein
MGAEDNEERPNPPGLINLWAAGYLSYLLNIPHLVFSGHHYFGETERMPLARVTANETIKELRAARLSRTISIVPSFPVKEGRTTKLIPVTETSGEVMAFLAFAQLHNLQRLALISNETHLPTIRQLLRSMKATAEVFSAEEVLLNIPGEIGHKAYKDYVKEIRESKDREEFEAREKIKRLLYALPGKIGVNWLRSKASRERSVSSTPPDWETIEV